VVLALMAPALAEFALGFSSFEYFWLALFGLSCAVFVSSGDPVKGIASVLLGLLLATVGIDPTRASRGSPSAASSCSRASASSRR
jgi:TctA family transporter